MHPRSQWQLFMIPEPILFPRVTESPPQVNRSDYRQPPTSSAADIDRRQQKTCYPPLCLFILSASSWLSPTVSTPAISYGSQVFFKQAKQITLGNCKTYTVLKIVAGRRNFREPLMVPAIPPISMYTKEFENMDCGRLDTFLFGTVAHPPRPGTAKLEVPHRFRRLFVYFTTNFYAREFVYCRETNRPLSAPHSPCLCFLIVRQSPPTAAHCLLAYNRNIFETLDKLCPVLLTATF